MLTMLTIGVEVQRNQRLASEGIEGNKAPNIYRAPKGKYSLNCNHCFLGTIL